MRRRPLRSAGWYVYTIRQRSNDRFVDAYETEDKDFAVATRPAQGDDTQRWIVVPSNEGSFTIRQLSNGRFLNAYQAAPKDFGAITRPRSDSSTERWLLDQI